MIIHLWEIINSEGKPLKTISTGKKDSKIAYEKMKFIFKQNVYFVKLQYKGAREI